MRRRSILATALTSGFAGCSRLIDQEISLGGFRIENLTNTEPNVDIEIKKDSDLVYKTTVENVQSAGEGEHGKPVLETEFLDCEWPTDTSGKFEITARLSGDNSWIQTSSDEANGDSQCKFLFLRIEETIRFYWEDCEEWEDYACESV